MRFSMIYVKNSFLMWWGMKNKLHFLGGLRQNEFLARWQSSACLVFDVIPHAGHIFITCLPCVPKC